MNAHAAAMTDAIPAKLDLSSAVRGFQQSKLLRRLTEAPAVSSYVGLAQDLSRDPDNTRKSLKALEADGLVIGFAITDLGRRALLALDVAEGRAEIGAGDPAETGILQLTHDQLIPNPLNPRKSFDGIEELAESIVGAGGLLVPLIVFPPRADGKRMLAAGERRYRAIGHLIERHQWLADETIPCIEREEDPAQTALIALIENGQREGLNLYDEAVAYTELMAALNCSAREAARLTGKSARKVQEAVQVVRDAAPEDVAAFREGGLTWEELRSGVRKPVEPPPRLPPHEELAASLREFGPAKAAVADDGQMDIEEIAPVTKAFVQPLVDLLPRETLALFEIEAACHVRPKLGFPKGTHIRRRGEAPELDALRKLGLITLDIMESQYVLLTPQGLRWLAGQPGAFMDADFRLRAARKNYFLTEEKIAALERDNRFFFDWLNVTPEAQAAAAAPKYTPTDAEALLLLEIYDWTQRQAEAMRWNGAPCRADFDREVCGRLQLLALLSFGGHTAGKGIWHMKVEPAGLAALRKRFPDLDHDGKRSKARGALHEALGVSPPPGGNGYATPWLNGPFEPDPAWVAKQAAIEAERAAQDAEVAARVEAETAIKTAWRKLCADVRTSDLAGAQAAIAAYLPTSPIPTPWRVVDEILYAANNEDISYGPMFAMANDLAAMCVNLMAGVAPSAWPKAPDEALTEPEYLEEIAATVYENCENGEPDVPMTLERARDLAKADLAARLERNCIAYGDPNYSWTADDAENDASDILTQLECGDLEGAEDAA